MLPLRLYFISSYGPKEFARREDVTEEVPVMGPGWSFLKWLLGCCRENSLVISSLLLSLVRSEGSINRYILLLLVSW